MHLPSTKALLDKITHLHQQIVAEQGKMSDLERDLMLDYLRQMYDQVLSAKSTAASAKPETSVAYTPPPPPPPPRREAAPAPKPVAPPPVPAYVAPPPPPMPVAPPPMPAPEPVYEAPKPEPVKPAPAPPSPEPPKMQESASSDLLDIPPAVRALFRYKKTATDLQEKLALRPIDDIKKGLSINDRMMIVNELFGRSAEQFEKYVGNAQQSGSYDAACLCFAQIAVTNRWTEDEKAPAVNALVTGLRRRFSA